MGGGGRQILLHSFLNTTPDGGEWLASRPGRFTPDKERRYPLNRRLGGPQSRFRGFVKRYKFLVPTGIRTPNRPARSLVANTDCANQTTG